MGNKVRAAAYGRVSTEKDDQANSLKSQRKYFSDYISQHEDWELTGIYYDEGISGTQTAKRKGFNQMIQDAMAGRIDLYPHKRSVQVCQKYGGYPVFCQKVEGKRRPGYFYDR